MVTERRYRTRSTIETRRAGPRPASIATLFVGLRRIVHCPDGFPPTVHTSPIRAFAPTERALRPGRAARPSPGCGRWRPVPSMGGVRPVPRNAFDLSSPDAAPRRPSVPPRSALLARSPLPKAPDGRQEKLEILHPPAEPGDFAGNIILEKVLCSGMRPGADRGLLPYTRGRVPHQRVRVGLPREHERIVHVRDPSEAGIRRHRQEERNARRPGFQDNKPAGTVHRHPPHPARQDDSSRLLRADPAREALDEGDVVEPCPRLRIVPSDGLGKGRDQMLRVRSGDKESVHEQR